MELEKKLQMLEKLREESMQNGSRINGACKAEKKDEKSQKSPISGFSIRMVAALLLFAGLLTLDNSPNTNARNIANSFCQSVSVDFVGELPYNQISSWISKYR